MKKYIMFSLIVLLSVSSSVFALNSKDKETINHIVDHFTNVWNAPEGRGFADYYAHDADFVNLFGTAFSGKQEIEARHIKILETFLKGSTFEVTDLRLREAAPDIVIVHVYWKVSNIQVPGKDPLNETMKGIFTHVFLRNNNDNWEIIASQNTTIKN